MSFPTVLSQQNLSDQTLLDFYYYLLKPRMIEEKMLKLLRQGKVSKWFSGIGQEAIAVGCTLAMESSEYVLPMHRNLGVFTTRNVPLYRLFAQFQGKNSGFTKGRDRSFHFGTNEYKIVGMISHLGPQLAIADGIALANKLSNSNEVTLVFTGEGGTSEGDFHEALNVAAVWQLPVIFVIENNGYGLSTPVSEQYNCKQLADRGVGYGMEAKTIDGNNLLEVYDTIKWAKQIIKNRPQPILIEAMTFRMRGHEEASGTKYVPKELMESWAKQDPLILYENFLKDQFLIDEAKIENYKTGITKEINEGIESAFNEAEVSATAQELKDVYYPHIPVVKPATLSQPKSTLRIVDAISKGLEEAMHQHQNLVIMGQDVADYGGVFKITEGFTGKFGKHRVRNTPLCESAIIGTGLGLSIKGYKSVIEMQFADFVTCGFNQIVNNLAKIHYRWGQNADVVVRMPTGGGVAAGPFHSQSTEAWFFSVPGLKIVYPTNPKDAKGLLLAAIEDPNPVMYFEHKAMYRSINGEVPDGYYTTEIGKAAIELSGEDISIITYGMGVHWAKKILEKYNNISAEIIDLRTLLPLDKKAIFTSVKKTGKAIVLHEACLTGGIGAEIAALINEHCFEFLDAAVVRVAALDTPIPFAPNLENEFMPVQRFETALQNLAAY